MRAAVGVLVGLVGLLTLAGCGGDDDVEALPPASDELVETEADATTTTTTRTTPTTTGTTRSELAEAEAEIEAAIVGWWTHDTDTSLGEAGLPLQFLTDPMRRRVAELGQRRDDDGNVQRARGNASIRLIDLRVELTAGQAEIDVCARGDDEVVDAESGEVLAADGDQAFIGLVFAELVEGEWKLRDFLSTQAGDDPEECEV